MKAYQAHLGVDNAIIYLLQKLEAHLHMREVWNGIREITRFVGSSQQMTRNIEMANEFNTYFNMLLTLLPLPISPLLPPSLLLYPFCTN